MKRLAEAEVTTAWEKAGDLKTVSGLVGPSQLALSLLGGERRYAWINVVLGLALTVVSGVLVLFMPFSMLNVLFLVTGLLMWFRGMRILMGLRRQDEVVRV